MTTLTIKVDEKSLVGKRFMSFLKTLPFVSIITEKSEKSGIDKALEDEKKGRVHKAKNTKDLMEKTTK